MVIGIQNPEGRTFNSDLRREQAFNPQQASSKHRLDYGVYPGDEIFDLLFRRSAVPLLRTEIAQITE
jgi:hypothetical protein